MLRVFLLSLILLAPAAHAQEEDGPFGDRFEGFEEDMRRLLEGLIDQMEPGMEALREQLGRLDAYHPPEILPNGDIIIRRKRPLDDAPPNDGEAPFEIPEGGVEL
ncbi:hypothetical protein [Ovoidimarina sediminis]|uniref:hypothetical protein n=1 Tax=Ovoidimarina sediminis TaxID=3079856 RepID=UPI0029138EA8|nr:hypothetical protein [Rhodophyticola sp. MJ-SS7]MDU8945023.1 hypothetical protein [Rhodophyticola sp. MJ-SS7]